MRTIRLKGLVAGIMVAVFLLASVGAAYGSSLDYKEFWYGSKYIRWESQLGLYEYWSGGSLRIRWVKAQAWCKSWWHLGNWNPWPISMMKVWVKMKTPTGYEASREYVGLNCSSVTTEVSVRYLRGRYNTVSTHRYWVPNYGNPGNYYYYKSLNDSWYFN